MNPGNVLLVSKSHSLAFEGRHFLTDVLEKTTKRNSGKGSDSGSPPGFTDLLW